MCVWSPKPIIFQEAIYLVKAKRIHIIVGLLFEINTTLLLCMPWNQCHMCVLLDIPQMCEKKLLKCDAIELGFHVHAYFVCNLTYVYCWSIFLTTIKRENGSKHLSVPLTFTFPYNVNLSSCQLLRRPCTPQTTVTLTVAETLLIKGEPHAICIYI